jgi:hypothetical protein
MHAIRAVCTSLTDSQGIFSRSGAVTDSRKQTMGVKPATQAVAQKVVYVFLESVISQSGLKRLTNVSMPSVVCFYRSFAGPAKRRWH